MWNKVVANKSYLTHLRYFNNTSKSDTSQWKFVLLNKLPHLPYIRVLFGTYKTLKTVVNMLPCICYISFCDVNWNLIADKFRIYIFTTGKTIKTRSVFVFYKKTECFSTGTTVAQIWRRKKKTHWKKGWGIEPAILIFAFSVS